MCRLLAVQAERPTDVLPWLRAFAERCRASREFQGDGWGIAWRRGDVWVRHRSVRPIWDDLPESLPRSSLFVAHARSAFRNEGVVEENNMPFLAGDLAFAFNGELRGVRLSAPGDTGAARLLHLFQRFRAATGGDALAGLTKLDEVITARSEYVRALNLVIGEGDRVWVHTHFSEDPDYFTLHRARIELDRGPTTRIVSSERMSLPGAEPLWEAIPNHTTCELREPVPC